MNGIGFVAMLGISLAVAGLIVGLITWIELFPRLSPGADLGGDASSALDSSRFAITNDGYFRLTDVTAACFLWRVKIGPQKLNNNFVANIAPREGILKVSEAMTVPCSTPRHFQIVGPSGPMGLTQADLGIVIYYRPWPLTIWRLHRMFRFVARFDDKGKIIAWDRQPAGDMEADFEEAVKSLSPFAREKLTK
jgi:hypothetical protein